MKALGLALLVLVVACSEERADVGGVCSGADCGGGVHGAGILDPASDDFHGELLRARSYDFALCASCHGDEATAPKGDAPACTTCHTAGPTACETCHGPVGPTSGQHPAHVTTLGPSGGGDPTRLAAWGGGAAPVESTCAECHTVPARWDAPGHILTADGQLDPSPVEVVLGAAANLTPIPGDRQGPATFENGSCRNVYCHGDTLAAGGLATEPAWYQPGSTAGCARCHGAPPPSHAQIQCATCHPTGAPHIDGTVQIGTSPDCAGCHGTTADGAPPRDLNGGTAITSIGVGAHQAHLTVPSGIRAPIACATCHVVPESVTSPGHLDTPLPAEVRPELGWDRTTGTCATSGCHGDALPVWTQTGGATCGSCHGIPPAVAPHVPSWGFATCIGCHPSPFLPSTAHMDGDVDVE